MRAVLLACLAVLLLAQPVYAQAITCWSRDMLVKGLADRHHEVPAYRALIDDGHLLEIFTSQDGRTWTAIITRPNGVSCPLIAGEDWRKAVPEPTGPRA